MSEPNDLTIEVIGSRHLGLVGPCSDCDGWWGPWPEVLVNAPDDDVYPCSCERATNS